MRRIKESAFHSIVFVFHSWKEVIDTEKRPRISPFLHFFFLLIKVSKRATAKKINKKSKKKE